MKVAIHNSKYTDNFSTKWIEYCNFKQIDYKLVNCNDSDIVTQLADCDGLLWHWLQWDCREVLFARQLIKSLEHKGCKVFPDSKTCWHFDDKVGQKYLLEAIKAPFVQSFVFYDEQQARNWAKETTYPKVFKLRGGAGSVNVKLVKDKFQANLLIHKAFRRGFLRTNRLNRLSDKFMKLKRNMNLENIMYLIKGLLRLIYPSYDDRMPGREKGYVYFQEFIPNNKYDIRVVVIGNKAFAIKRYVRKNDFRASGSGNFAFDQGEIPIECVQSAFQIAKSLQTQCIALDFITDGKAFLIVEISYGFVSRVYLSCPGYWDNELNWHQGSFIPEWLMIEDFIAAIVS